MSYRDYMRTGIIGISGFIISLFVTMIVLICLNSCNRQQSYGYWNGIYQPPPQEIDDYEKP
jgi:hypothetical protein